MCAILNDTLTVDIPFDVDVVYGLTWSDNGGLNCANSLDGNALPSWESCGGDNASTIVGGNQFFSGVNYNNGTNKRTCSGRSPTKEATV